MKGKKSLGLLLIFTFTLTLTGCWGRTEINDIAIASAVTLDRSEDGQILMSILVADPKKMGNTSSGSGSGSSSNGTTLIFSDKGKGIMDTYRKIQEKIPREIFFSHLRIIAIGEKLAREGVGELLDFFTRYREAHLRVDIVFTRQQAIDLLNADPGLERLTSEIIREELNLGIGKRITLLEFFTNITEEGVEAYAPEFETTPFKAENNSNADSKDTGTEKMTAAIKGSAVFKNDKLVGWLDDKETRGAMNIFGASKGAIITADIPEEMGGGFVSVRIPALKSKILPKIKDGNLEVDVKVTMECRTFESESKIDLSDPKQVHYLEKKVEEAVEQRIRLALDKLQKDLNSDIFGFGAAFYRKYHKEWEENLSKHWDEIYPNLKINVDCKVTIARIGFSTKSITLKESEFVK